MLEQREDIVREVVGFYQSLFGSHVDTRRSNFSEIEGARIEYSFHTDLCLEVTNAEILADFKGIGAKKSPGLDGFGRLFFTACWDIVKDDVCWVVREFFRRSRLLRQMNATFVNVIPKIDNPTSTREFRPIAYCNTMMKVMSKILVARIRPLLDDIVSDNQGAFVPSRRIVDNLAVALKGYDSKVMSPRCLI